ncbi:nuclear transport factor 2 family protein [Actinomadura xylanilytica]|uniref:nuclear transport factor 2 family protein n=1 Tax=Actinomadura xylanilytica TaxID=887459 RepID=UPI00255B2D0F|nr:nuclear transport factor 2 family protein [Actinomadura xylanilytica]MDL4775808.1 nuclear transport factor 2 family protein [Actinomadura xylanilytica]
MTPFHGTDPKKFIADFHTSFHDELVDGDEDTGVIVDRYHTPDIVQIADGHRMDREKLIAHARPVRKNRPSGVWEVHEAVANGDRIAARSTLHVTNRNRKLTLEVYFFGQFTPDGRMRRGHSLTRTVPLDAAPEQAPGTPGRQEASA